MKKLFFYIAILSVFFSCEDPIDVEVAEAPAQVVIDAYLNNLDTIQQIKVSMSTPLFQTKDGSAVTDATVTVNNITSGTSLAFNHTGDGLYTFSPDAGSVVGEIGDEFTLEIERQGERYTAATRLNGVPEIDSINQEERVNEILGPDGIYCQFFATDLEGLGDSYWIKSYKNGEYLNRPFEINLAFDAGFDSGTPIDNIIFIPPLRELVNPVDDELIQIPYVANDTLRVEIHSISNETFFFMETVRDQLLNSLNGIFAEPLANARGNIKNETGDTEVLGIFNVAAISSLQYIVK